MTEDFRDQRQDAATRSPSRVRRLWLSTIGGLMWLATREHIAAVVRDVRHSVRLFRRRPAFTLTTILTLTAGIGVTTATFSIVQAIVLQQIPGPESERLVSIFEVGPAPEGRQGPVSNANFVDWKPQVTTLDGLSLYNPSAGLVQVEGAPAEQLVGLAVSDDFMTMTGLAPRLGRLFVAEDFQAWHAAYASGANSTPRPRVMVLSESAWRRVFGARADIVGKTIQLNDSPVEVIGVIAEHPLLKMFSTASSDLDYWVPGGAWSMVARRARAQQSLGRLAPGMTIEDAQAEFNVIAARLESEHPDANTGWTIRVVALREAVTTRVTSQLLFLLGASLGVALIAVLNVARLMATLNEARRHEFLTRLALGASRFELSRQAITESLVLSLVGGGLGVLLARLALPGIVALAPGDIPRLSEVALHPQTMGFALGLTLAVGIVCGLASHLSTHGRLVTGAQFTGGRPAWGPTILLGAQVAIALVLTIGTTVLVRSMQLVAAEPLGFMPDNVIATSIALPRSVLMPEAHERTQQLIERLEAHPGVVRAASGPRPLGPGRASVVRPKNRQGDGVPMQVGDITSDYFLVVGAAIRSGRGFVDADRTSSPTPAVLNEQAVEALGLGSDPRGHELVIERSAGETAVVVGVVANIRQVLETAPAPAIYLPATQSRASWSNQLLIRTNQAPAAFLPELRSIVRDLDPTAGLHRIQTMDERIRELTAPRRFIMQLVTTFSVLAIVLAVIGLAGVVADSVSQRVREIGIRMALGARSGAIIALMVRQATRVVAIGAVAGLAIAYQLRTTLEGFVYGVTTMDVWSYGTATAAVVFTSLVACYLPARRATTINPVIALRRE